jgi:hypothetical protein
VTTDDDLPTLGWNGLGKDRGRRPRGGRGPSTVGGGGGRGRDAGVDCLAWAPVHVLPEDVEDEGGMKSWSCHDEPICGSGFLLVSFRKQAVD